MNKKKRKSTQIAPIRPEHIQLNPNIPAYDYFEDIDLEESWDVDQALTRLINDLKQGTFLQWEAVIRREQGMRITRQHRAAISKLLWFGDRRDAHGPILYIDGVPRPDRLWYEIAQEIVPRILEEPFRTTSGGRWGSYEGWPELIEVLEKHTQGLSLPEGVEDPIDIIPLDLRHRLNLQLCFDALSGLGQEEELTLENEEQRDRLDWFIGCLRDHKESVRYLELTLDNLLAKIVMPPRDEKILVRELMQQLGMTSMQEYLADFL